MHKKQIYNCTATHNYRNPKQPVNVMIGFLGFKQLTPLQHQLFAATQRIANPKVCAISQQQFRRLSHVACG